MDTQLKTLIDNFVDQFHKDMESAKMSGAIDTASFTDVEIGRAVLQITAEKFAPLSPANKKMAKNLQHFI